MKLKNINIGLGLVALVTFSSCADDKFSEYRTDMTKNQKEYQYLNSYKPLKDYVEEMKAAGKCNPDFKLGIAVDVAEFNKGEIVSSLAGSNFTELTADNAMKHLSFVKNDGSFKPKTVADFVANAKSLGMTIYGHTLAWHSQQNTAYLRDLITDPNAVKHVLHVKIPEAKTQVWDWELYVDPIKPLEKGKTYTLNARVKSESEYNVTVWPQGDATQYWPTPSFVSKKGWTVISQPFQATQENIKQIRFELGTFSGDFWIDDVQLLDPAGNNLIKEGEFEDGGMAGWSKPSWHNYTLDIVNDPDQDISGGGITDEVRKDTLSWAMGKWIDAMMETCDGYVTTWDVVNEAISGVDKDGDGFYDLQSATRGTVSADDAKANFYWQDYLGDLDYVRIAVADARKSFAAHNGDPSKLKLFINDYNLESTWDNNKKLESLIHWINEWESDGVTKIDGIASQMHVSFNANPAAQKSQEEHIVRMLQLMANTGKLVKISELDMGYIAEDGKTHIMTEDITEAQHRQMSDFYKFIVSKYFEIVPVAQQYGITQWCATDSPADSGWRKGEPTGLWDRNYLRKQTYVGFAEGLGAEHYENAE